MDAALVSRLQFGLTIAFHYIFPPLTIGLGLFLVISDGLYLKTRDRFYKNMTQFWVRIFGLIFALGVSTGIVMEFEFGTNWATYSRFVGDVFGSALAAEGIFAFFLESGFLAILLFGWEKVKPGTHFLATVMVALGAHFSAIWIVVANSWMQTPAGYRIVEHGALMRAEVADFWQVVFNPSTLDRISHVYMGCWQAGAFLVLSVSAWYLLKKKHRQFAVTSMKIAIVIALFSSVMQLVTGDFSARGVAKTQPAKMASLEGHFPANEPAGMYLFGWVDTKNETTHGLEIPGLLSFMLYGDASKPVTGLDAIPKEDRPPVAIVFQSFHAMVAIGMLLILLAIISTVGWWRGFIFEKRWLLWVLVFSVLLPQLANQLGWFTAELGRQPWIVYGLLRTEDAVSKNVSVSQVEGSLVIFGIIYFLLGALFIYLLDSKIKHGPDDLEPLPEGHRA
ncbi:MAG TPA: cytochrome ubiquinol oxidase subunit I [candidate division Zixibacteria bacterium]|nr:cytochrome ubiquinol oxidase subunit I [candidate division Zixibacteria bacterium]